MRPSILKNIVEFQKEAARISSVRFGNKEALSWVYNNPGMWPHAMLGIAGEAAFNSVLSKIEEQQLPPVWIMAQEEANEQILKLEAAGFREINRWEGMWLHHDKFEPLDKFPEKYSQFLVNDNNMAQHWWNIVKPVMLPNLSIPAVLLEEWTFRQEYQLVLGMYDDQPASAGMFYQNKDVAGLYFIATLPQFRGKGFASALVRQLIAGCFQRGVEEVVLHASGAGRLLYEKMGFVAAGPISTYWKVGLF